MNVGTTCLLRGTSTAAGNSPRATAPTGHVLIVKSILVTNQSSTQRTINVYGFDSAGTMFISVLTKQLASAEIALAELWLALNQGDAIQINFDGDNVAYWISGTVLSGIPEYTIPPNTTTATKPVQPISNHEVW